MEDGEWRNGGGEVFDPPPPPVGVAPGSRPSRGEGRPERHLLLCLSVCVFLACLRVAERSLQDGPGCLPGGPQQRRAASNTEHPRSSNIGRRRTSDVEPPAGPGQAHPEPLGLVHTVRRSCKAAALHPRLWRLPGEALRASIRREPGRGPQPWAPRDPERPACSRTRSIGPPSDWPSAPPSDRPSALLSAGGAVGLPSA